VNGITLHVPPLRVRTADIALVTAGEGPILPEHLPGSSTA
jgi:hypothetical protein